MHPPHGIMFHHFHEDDGGTAHRISQGSIAAGELARLIEHIGPERILPAREFLHRAQIGALGSGDVCLTFDDALRCQYELALPVLRRYDLTAFWFLYTSVLQGHPQPLEIYRHFRTTQFNSLDAFYAAFFEALKHSPDALLAEALLEEFNPRAYLTAFPFYSDADRKFRFVRDEILGPVRYQSLMDALIADSGMDVRAIARNLWLDDGLVRELHSDDHVIGLHSHTHPTRLEHLKEDEQREEYFENYAYLSNLLDGERPLAMSHPCNSYNGATLTILRELGIVLGFCSNMLRPVAPTSLEYPREDHANLVKRLAA